MNIIFKKRCFCFPHCGMFIYLLWSSCISWGISFICIAQYWKYTLSNHIWYSSNWNDTGICAEKKHKLQNSVSSTMRGDTMSTWPDTESGLGHDICSMSVLPTHFHAAAASAPRIYMIDLSNSLEAVWNIWWQISVGLLKCSEWIGRRDAQMTESNKRGISFIWSSTKYIVLSPSTWALQQCWRRVKSYNVKVRPRACKSL